MESKGRRRVNVTVMEYEKDWTDFEDGGTTSQGMQAASKLENVNIKRDSP